MQFRHLHSHPIEKCSISYKFKYLKLPFSPFPPLRGGGRGYDLELRLFEDSIRGLVSCLIFIQHLLFMFVATQLCDIIKQIRRRRVHTTHVLRGLRTDFATIILFRLLQIGQE